MLSLDSIPQELVVKAILYCDYVSIVRFSTTCRLYWALVRSSSAIQLRIELESSGFQHSDEFYRGAPESTALELLNQFKRYRDGWLYLKMGSARKLPVDDDMRLYELRQGYYAAALSSSLNPPGIVKLLELSTGSSRILSLGLNFSEFQIDISQELMVLVGIEDSISETSTIHFRSALKGSPHEGTQHPSWKVHLPFPMYRRSSGIFIEVMDDLLAVKYTSFDKDTTEILIWNWKRGVLLNRIPCTGASCTFGFLTSDSLLLFISENSETAGVTLHIYNNIRTPQTPSSDHARYYRVSLYDPLLPYAAFEFPAFPPGSMTYLLLRGEPVPTMTRSGSAPFLPCPDVRVLQLSMTLIQNQGQERGLRQYQVFISKEKLLKHLSALGGRSKESESPIKVPWSEWGEYSTRWFASRSAISPWICRAYGTRFIQSNPLRDEGDEFLHEYISILDFHPPTVRRFSSLESDKRLSIWKSKDDRRHIDMNSRDEDLECVLNALRSAQADLAKDSDRAFVDTIDEDVPSETPFNGEIIRSRLPYRIVRRVRPLPKHSGWMIDNNMIIGMPGDDMENIQHEHMNIYTPYAHG
ncbi:hypothetical protein RhiJN_23568 [Ceratobasidium sp. AG-Ba]|nr:hypothetical protein RhiJN_23568 [Ceratobasidium sp. AG-Ba]